MTVTRSTNIADSLLFLLSARDAIRDTVEFSSIGNKEEVKNFITNEASDYQVMSLLINGELPKEKFNFIKEINLFSELKSSIIENHDLMVDLVGEKITENILFEVDSIYPEYSSARPIMEFLVASEGKVVFTEITPEAKIKAVQSLTKKIAAQKVSYKKMFDVWKKASPKMKTGIAARLTKQKGAIDGLKKQIKTIQLTRVQKLVGTAKGIAGTAVATGKKQAKQVGGAIAKGAKTAAGVAVKGAAAAAPLAAKVPGAAVAGKALGVSTAVGGGAVAMSALAVAALLTYAGVKAYKRFLSQAAKACKGKSGAEKTACMKAYKAKGIKAQIATIKSGMSKCAKTKNPEKCKKALATKIAGLQKKFAKTQG